MADQLARSEIVLPLLAEAHHKPIYNGDRHRPCMGAQQHWEFNLRPCSCPAPCLQGAARPLARPRHPCEAG